MRFRKDSALLVCTYPEIRNVLGTLSVRWR